MRTPNDTNINDGVRYALDNGAYSCYVNKEPFNEEAFYRTLKRYPNADFVVIPDIVRGGLDSLSYSMQWRQILSDSYSWYLAVQDGMTPDDIPGHFLNRIDGIFVGGSKPWKWATSHQWSMFAHSKGLKLHIGRVGTLQRIMWAFDVVKADSIDSSNLAKHEGNWRQLTQYLNGEHRPLEQFITA